MFGIGPLARFALTQYPELVFVGYLWPVENFEKVMYVLSEDRNMVVEPRKRVC